MDHNDEYQFDEDAALNTKTQTATHDTVPANHSMVSGLLQKITRRHILLGLGVIVLLGVLYSVIGYMFSRARHVQPVSVPAATTLPVVKPVDPTTAEITANTEQTAQLKNRFDQLSARLDEQQNTVKRLDFMLGQLQAQATANNAILTKLSTQWDEQQAKQKALEEAKKKALAKKAAKASKPKITYVVKAMVPGRAWLQSSDGEALTVRVGDNLPDAGTITVLDVDQGMIATSAGTTIQYSPNDR